MTNANASLILGYKETIDIRVAVPNLSIMEHIQLYSLAGLHISQIPDAFQPKLHDLTEDGDSFGMFLHLSV